VRSWSSRRTGSPDGATRALAREAWISIRATRPWTSGSDELGQHAAEAQRVLTERGPHPVVAGRRRVALVEDEVDDLEHRGQARGEIVPAGDLVGDPRLGERALRPDDPLGDGRLGDEERARDLRGRQASEQAQGERDSSLGGEDRVTGREHEEEVVAHVVVEGGLERGHGRRSLRLELAAELLVLALEPLAAAQPVDRPILRGGHEPGPGVFQDTRRRPPLERHDEGVLRELLGETDVSHDPREDGDQLRGLHPEDRLDLPPSVLCRHGSFRLGARVRTCLRPPTARRGKAPARR
jgi:hypothetical protein